MDDRVADKRPSLRASPRFGRAGANWKMLLIWVAAIAITAAWGRFHIPLLILVVELAILFALNDAIYLATARLVGMREIIEVGVWLGPAVLWCRIKGLLLRANLLPIGSYVRFPDREEDGSLHGFARLNPLRKTALAISAPLCFAIVGWGICCAHGLADGPVRVARWLAANEIRSLATWKVLFAAFLENIALPSGAGRAFGMLMLANGIINLLPLPLFSGGMAISYLLEPVLGRKNAWLVLKPFGIVGVFLFLTMTIMGIAVFVGVVFGRGD